MLYWGSVDGDVCNDKINSGYHISSVRLPRWIGDGTILTFGSVLTDCETQRGIFRLDIDPSSFELQRVIRFVYDQPIWIHEYDWLPEEREVALVYSNSPEHRGVAKARLESSKLVLGPEQASEWQPFGVSHWPGHEGFVFYGTNPVTYIGGFYWMRDGDSTPDSLLVAYRLSSRDAHSFDFSSDGSQLYLGIAASTEYFNILQIDLTTGSEEIVLSREGELLSLDVHPSASRILLSRWTWGDGGTSPGSYADILDLASRKVTSPDVKTHPCIFTIAERAVWRESGGAFAFLGGGFSGEGDYWPLDLWTNRVPR